MWLLLLNLYFDSGGEKFMIKGEDNVNDSAAVLNELSDDRNIRRHQLCSVTQRLKIK